MAGAVDNMNRVVTNLFTQYMSRAMRKLVFMSYVNNKGADQPAHPRSLISTFVVRCLDSVMFLVSVTKISSLVLASVAEQASLSLTWSETPKDTFSHDEAHMKNKGTDQPVQAQCATPLLFAAFIIKCLCMYSCYSQNFKTLIDSFCSLSCSHNS